MEARAGGLSTHSDDGLLSQFQDDKQGSESNNGALTNEQRCNARSQGSSIAKGVKGWEEW